MIKDLLHSAATAVAAVGGTLVMAPPVVGLSLVEPELPDGLIRFWARTILRAADVRVQSRGLENLEARRCVMVCNHQSYFDVLVMLSELKRHVRFVAKAELFRIPVFGQAIAALGVIKVERHGAERDHSAIMAAVPAVRDRTDLVFFPEGTRAEGELGPFKKGAAVLALSAQVPIVPMAVAGTREILPPGGRRIHSGRRAVLVVGEPISTDGKTIQDRDEVTARCRDAVQKLLDDANALVAAG